MSRDVSRSNFSVIRDGKGLVVAILVAMVTIGAMLAFASIKAREAALNNARLSAQNVEQLIAGSTLRLLRSFDMSIEQVISGLHLTKNRTVPDDLFRQILFDHSASYPLFHSIRVLNVNGDVVLDSRDVVPSKVNYADRDYFKAQITPGGPPMYVSAPHFGKTHEGMAITLSRRIEDENGDFKGVVAGGVSIAALQQLLDSSNLGDQSAAAIFRSDGTIMARHPKLELDAVNQKSSPLLQHFAVAASGVYQAVSSVDGVDRVTAYGQVGDFPLVVLVGVSKDAALADWKRRTIIAALLTLALMAIVVLLGSRFLKQLKEQDELRRELEKANLELLEMSRVDKLTGLRNRRAFDECLEMEWQRHFRTSNELSLLMIDVDHFKAFNDQFGHKAGDDALKTVADCIDDVSKRSTDVACRYGGEEFAVILPNTSKDAAVRLAWALLDKIASARVNHVTDVGLFLSASIGVATTTPRSAVSGKDGLLVEADEALYLAKELGRNRVEVKSARKQLQIVY